MTHTAFRMERFAALGLVASSLTIGATFAGNAAPPHFPPALDCQRQPQLERWVQAQADRWQRVLATQPGYERPESVTVCRIDRGNPCVNYDRDRIYLRSRDADEDRLSLAHEYLHLAFKHHPVARNERFIESTARKLVKPYSFELEQP